MKYLGGEYIWVKIGEGNLRTTAITKVKEAMVLTIDARKVGDVYLKLAKYMFRVELTLQP